MNTNLVNPKKVNNNISSSKKNKCKCGKTNDANGNCDGSHANKQNHKIQISKNRSSRITT